MNSKAVIHLSKVDHNLKAISSRLKAGVKKMAVVKDNGYGHGMEEISIFIKDKVEWFCVARAEEGRKLRESGIQNPILVFESPRLNTVDLYSKYNLTATLADISILNILKSGTQFHINIDTGMRRLGILQEDISTLRAELSKAKDLECTGIYTHYFKADDPGNKEVENQLKSFKDIRSEFPSEWMTHTANTGGIFHYQHLDLQFDAVRPGVCLYGFGAGAVTVNELDPILDWKSFLMQVKRVKKGDSVSYGARWIAPKDGFIGVIPSGYSDGIPRRLGGKFKVMIDGKLFQQIGTISMDYMMVYLENQEFETGTEVYLLKGTELSAASWAEISETIPYEITTNIKESVKREFI